MPPYRRYALYYAPPAGSALARFGASWLGWDAEAGAPAAHPVVAGLPHPVEEITATPRKYGFHGTLKPPFRTEADPARLMAAAATLAAGIAPFEAPPLKLSAIGPFLALTPSAPSAALAGLAAACVTELDQFRAPLNEAELAKRRRAAISPRQEANLSRWGYPYVLEEFRFHLTLSGRMAAAEVEQTRAALADLIAPFEAAAMPVREIAMFGEDAAGRFHIVRRLPLTG